MQYDVSSHSSFTSLSNIRQQSSPTSSPSPSITSSPTPSPMLPILSPTATTSTAQAASAELYPSHSTHSPSSSSTTLPPPKTVPMIRHVMNFKHELQVANYKTEISTNSFELWEKALLHSLMALSLTILIAAIFLPDYFIEKGNFVESYNSFNY
ncbi:3821_t:CDS:1 [Paraglomus brasilianum]|uniref:3821_t:CDS:1 n=1 Tax=Paraglomus brasilianum TaxID=144538 RepID=A0A9N8WPX9_9GLOM|nr:3821_t:CDS:1 [Paraglomus brasilianum]